MHILRIVVIAIFLIFQSMVLQSQICLPSGMTFSNQGSIDRFSILNPGCTEIDGAVTIKGDDIVNLNGLTGLTTINGNLSITFNSLLTNLDGLESLEEVSTLFISSNPALTDISALNEINQANGIQISSNNILPAINAFNHLNSISQTLYISGICSSSIMLPSGSYP